MLGIVGIFIFMVCFAGAVTAAAYDRNSSFLGAIAGMVWGVLLIALAKIGLARGF